MCHATRVCADRYTKDPKQLLYAERAADYYLKNVGRAFVPLWDFDAPKNESWPDTSAAAITASALVELSAATGNATCVPKLQTYNLVKIVWQWRIVCQCASMLMY